MSLTEALHRALARDAAGRAVVDGEGALDWRAFAERVGRAAGALRALGLRPGDRVVLLARNGRRVLEAFFGAAWAGAVLVPVNPRLAPAEVGAILRDAEPHGYLVDAACLETYQAVLRDAAGAAPIVFAEPGAAPAGLRAYEALLAAAAPAPDARVPDGELAGLYYTGGTTGQPKGVMLSHGNLLANLPAAADFEPDTVYLHAAPMVHLGSVRYIVAVTAAGGAHAFLPRFDPVEVRAAIARWGVTAATLVPAAIQALVGGGARREELASLRQLRYGGSPMPAPVLAAAQALLPQCRFHQGYGMTETASVATVLGPQDHAAGIPERLRSAGLPSPGVELRVAGPDGAALPPEAVGEVLLRGPQVMLGYWRRPELTAEALRGGWFHTGDLGRRDAAGYLTLVDRLKDMIVTNGENVYSAEVEQAILRLPGVAACAVFGVPHPRWGEAVHAVVVPKPGEALTARQVVRHCRGLLARYKCPRGVTLRAEPLPLSASGKVDKTSLRAPHWAGRARQVN